MRKKYWSRIAQSITPYTPGEQPKIPDLIKLNTNENPYPPSPKVIAAVQEAANARLRLYPDPQSTELREALANRHRLKRGQIFVGNGSDEVLAMCFMAFFDPDSPIKSPDISYSFYPVYAQLFGMQLDSVTLREDFTLPVESLFHSEGGVIFANPNAPTSMAIPAEDVKNICVQNERVVIIDEAYVEFGAQSAVELISCCPNLVVVKTFSKSHALAGMRIGYALASEELIEALNRVKNSFNSYTINRVGEAAAVASISDEVYCQKTIQRIIETRNMTISRMIETGFTCLDSKANFLFCTHSTLKSDYIFKELRKRGIIVRHFPKPRIDNYLRITIGTEDEMERLLYAMKQII